MKFLVLVILAVVAVTQAKYLMSPNSLCAATDRNEMTDEPQVSKGRAQAAIPAKPKTIYVQMAVQDIGWCADSDCLALCEAYGYNYGVCCCLGLLCKCYN